MKWPLPAILAAALLPWLPSIARSQEPGSPSSPGGPSKPPTRQLPRYVPGERVHGVIRTWGSDEMGPMMKAWEKGFLRFQPEIYFDDTLKGSETAQAGIYTGVADMALSGREVLPGELYGIYKLRRYFPTEVTVATGSVDIPEKTYALAVFVHRDNPLQRLTLSQLDGIFGDERSGGWDGAFRWHPEVARSAAENVRTWGQLGLTGEWAAQQIHPYSYPTDVHYPSVYAPGARYVFGRDVLRGGDKWSQALREYDRNDELIAALGADRYGIGYTCLSYKTAELKAIALGRTADACVPISKATVASRTYPLTRSVYVYLDKDPHLPAETKVREFLRYVLSADGQQAVAADRGYLPLTADVIRQQRAKIE